MKNRGVKVSLIIPCRNEENYIRDCLDSLLSQTYPKQYVEILILDGMSTDRTREIVEEYIGEFSRILLVDNPEKVTPCAMNKGISLSSGDCIMKIDAHTVYDPVYVEKCVKYLYEYEADNVGGILKSIHRNNTAAARAIKAILSSPFGVGNSYFRVGVKRPLWVDTVSFGCYRREVFDKIGLYNEFLWRGQDMEFNLRLKKAGGKILLHPEIIGYYYFPSTVLFFIRHTFRNGEWAIIPFKYSSVLPISLRHFVPLVFVLGIIGLVIGGLIFPRLYFLLALLLWIYFSSAFYFSVLSAIKEKDTVLVAVAPIFYFLFHFLYGMGSLWGGNKCLFSLKFWRNISTIVHYKKEEQKYL